MIKRIILFAITLVIVFFAAYYLYNFYITNNGIVLPFSLSNVYFFQFIIALLVYVITEIAFIKLPNEAGYLFLGLTMIQFGVFFLIFKDAVFAEKPLTKVEKLSFIIPLFLSLIFEVIAVVKQLNNNEFSNKNAFK